MSEHTSFLTIFPGCSDYSCFAGGLDKAYVTDVQIDRQSLSMTISAWFSTMPSPSEINNLSERLKDDYGLEAVVFIPDYPRPKGMPVGSYTEKSPDGSAPKGDVLYGKPIKQKPVPMNTLSLESGRVTVEGDVIAVTSRSLAKNGSAVLCFDITDRTNSVRISRFLRSDDDQSVITKINVGDHLAVQGEIVYSKYDDDMVLDPKNIVKGKKYIRPDNAEEKRVELHLHTRFSALDALTDPAAAVKRAEWLPEKHIPLPACRFSGSGPHLL